MKRMKRWICMIIALCMVAGLMPVNTLLLHAHAEEGVTSCADDVHMWDEGEQTQEPTAEAPGVRTFTCTQCGETRNEEIPYEAPVCSHIWDEGEETQEATAEAPGIRTFTCTQCGETTNEEIPFEAPICNHVWDEGEETQEATAEAPGVRTFTCTLCGETKIEEIPYEAPVCNHQWDEGESAGTQMVYTCTLCGEQMPQEIAATQGDSSWVLPCSFTSVLTPFGYRESSITGESTYHQGVDLDTGTGDPVVASREGVIVAASYGNSAGYYVQIDHQDGFRSIYMHLSSYSVSVGQIVSAGQYIGATGATGITSNGDHLHFGISLNGVYVNPANYVSFSLHIHHTPDLDNVIKADYTECSGGWIVDYSYCTECGQQCTLGGAPLDWETDYKDGNGKHTPDSNRIQKADYTECGGGWTVDYTFCAECNQQCTLGGAPLDWETDYKDGNGKHTPDSNRIQKADYTECGGGWTVDYTFCVECNQQCTLSGAPLDWETDYKDGNGKHTPDSDRIQKADYTECGGGWTVDYTSCTVCRNQCTLGGAPLDWETYHKDGNGKHTADLNRIQKADFTECGGGWTVNHSYCTVCGSWCTLDGDSMNSQKYYKDGNGQHTPNASKIRKANYTECGGGWIVDYTYCIVCNDQCTLNGESLDFQLYHQEGSGKHSPNSETFMEPTYTTCGGGYIAGFYICSICGQDCKADGSELNQNIDFKAGSGHHTPNMDTLHEPTYTTCGGGYTVSYYNCAVCGTTCKADGSKLNWSMDYVDGDGKHTPDESTFHEADYYPCSGGYLVDYYYCAKCGTPCKNDGTGIYDTEYQAGNKQHTIDANGICQVCGQNIVSGQCGDNLFWEIDNGTLVISGTGDMYDYEDSNTNCSPWATWGVGGDRQITAIELREGITYIGEVAFLGLEGVTSIKFPSTLKKIGQNAFEWCSITELYIPETVEEIEQAAFYGCEDLRTVTIAADSLKMGDRIFAYCSALKTIQFAGNAPKLVLTENRLFERVFATAYYPANDPTWTDDVKKNYGGNITWVAKESTTTLDLTGTPLEGAAAITIDGKQYAGADIVNGKVDLKRTDAKTAVVYTYNGTSDDPHKNYPTGMKVYLLNYTDDGYQVVAVPELDNLLQYKGSSIRMTGNKGIRMITGVPDSIRAQLISAQVAGYTLEEYGTVLAFADQMQGGSLTLSDSYAKSNYAYKRGISDAVYAKADGLTQYTNVLVGFTMDQCSQDIAMRPYIKLKDASGDVITIYGGIVQRSIGYIAWQNRNTFATGSDGYNYIWDIINAVYKNGYPAD